MDLNELKLRIKEITNLEKGWYDNLQGVKFKKNDIDFTFNILKDVDFSNLYIYPFPDNEITIEWDSGELTHVISLCFSSKSFIVIVRNKKKNIFSTEEPLSKEKISEYIKKDYRKI